MSDCDDYGLIVVLDEDDPEGEAMNRNTTRRLDPRDGHAVCAAHDGFNRVPGFGEEQKPEAGLL